MSEATITRGPAALVGLSSVYSAAVAYLTLLIAARTLNPADNATFLVYWALLFGAYGVVTGVSPEAARASYRIPQDHRPLLVAVGLAFGAIVAVMIAASGPLWADHILGDRAWLSSVAALACLAYSGHLALWGVVTGRRNWAAVAGLVIAEATVRLGLIVLALLFFDSIEGLAIGAALPALTWVVALGIPVFRAAAKRRGDVPASQQLRNYAVASLATSASALLMVGFPVLISATSSHDELASSAGLMLGISLTRAPLLVPLTALQGVALAHFLGNSRRGTRALSTTVGPVLGLSAVGAVFAYLIGPWLFRILLGASYDLNGITLAALTVSAGLLASLTLTGMFALAVSRHVFFAAGWITATLAAVLCLLMPLPLLDRVLLSLLIGPLIGITVHVFGLSRALSPATA